MLMEVRKQPCGRCGLVRDPQHVASGTAMPDLHVSAGDARDITASLYTRAND
jgi:hypothetical protein